MMSNLFKNNNDILAKPFVKWVGGKRQMLKSLTPFLNINYNKYIEPFVGGGAVFFHSAPKTAILNDFNKELITAYRVIKNKRKLALLINELNYNYFPYSNCEDKYYQIRGTEHKDTIKSTARFIYLNKTGYNGMYRVNQSGKFNIPFGKKKNPIKLNEENLWNCQKALKGVKLLSGDFYKTLKYIEKNDLVYLDPPYAPLSSTSNFTQYTKLDFNSFDQERLRDYCNEIDKKGAKFILNNSDVELIHKLYNKYKSYKTSIRRMVGAKSESRILVNELIITNIN